MTCNGMNALHFAGAIGSLGIGTIRVFSKLSHFSRNNVLLNITRVLKISRYPPSKRTQDYISFVF